MERRISDFEERLKKVEELVDSMTVTLDRLITAHNNLSDDLGRLEKAHDNVTAEMAQTLDDIREALDLALGKAAPLHGQFLNEVQRVLRNNPTDKK